MNLEMSQSFVREGTRNLIAVLSVNSEVRGHNHNYVRLDMKQPVFGYRKPATEREVPLAAFTAVWSHHPDIKHN